MTTAVKINMFVVIIRMPGQKEDLIFKMFFRGTINFKISKL